MSGVTGSDPTLFYALLRPIVRQGLPLGEAVRTMRGEGGIAAGTLEAMADEIDEGSQLSGAMERYPKIFPAPVPALMAVGERSGDLTAAVDHCARLARHRRQLHGHLSAGLVYPGICLLLVLGLALVHALLAPFGEVGALSRLGSSETSSARVLLAGALRVLVPVLAAALITGIWLLFLGPNRTVSRDRALLNLPVVGRLYRLSVASKLTRALGALLAAGLPVDRAVEAAIPAAGNVWAQRELEVRLAGVRDGQTLSGSLALPGIFPPSLSWRLAVGEERGSLPEALECAADAYEEEWEIGSARLARMIEPAGMILVGLLAMLAVWLWFGKFQVLGDARILGMWG